MLSHVASNGGIIIDWDIFHKLLATGDKLGGSKIADLHCPIFCDEQICTLIQVSEMAWTIIVPSGLCGAS